MLESGFLSAEFFRSKMCSGLLFAYHARDGIAIILRSMAPNRPRVTWTAIKRSWPHLERLEQAVHVSCGAWIAPDPRASGSYSRTGLLRRSSAKSRENRLSRNWIPETWLITSRYAVIWPRSALPTCFRKRQILICRPPSPFYQRRPKVAIGRR